MRAVATPVRNRESQRRILAACLALLAMGCWLAILGGSDARAATSYSNSGEFAVGYGYSPTPPQVWGPTRLAVDDPSGNVLIVDSDDDDVEIFGPADFSTQLTTFGSGELSAPYGIAIDQSSHAVYVSDAGNNRIVRYTGNNLPVPTYTLDITYPSPAQGSGAGEIGSFKSPIAIDPTNGDLLVADTGNLRVSRYTSSGTFVTSFTGAETAAGAFQNLLDLTVDAAGTAYVVDLNGSIHPQFGTVDGTSRVERFSPAGAAQGRLGAGALDTARSITFGSSSGNVAVATQAAAGEISTLHVYHDDAPLVDIPYPADTVSSSVVGLAIDDGSSGRLYALTAGSAYDGTDYNFGIRSVQVFDPVPLPDVVLDVPTAVTAMTAHLSGTVDPLGVSADYRFEYSTDGTNWTPTTDQNAGSGSGPTPVSADLADLAPNLEYQVRLRATNANGTMFSQMRTFTTDVSAPETVTKPATDRTTSGATLRGTVNPYGKQTTYHFEYGPSTDYGSRAPVANEATAGNGRTARSASFGLSGLQPATTYHYRLVARNSVGETSGADRSFTTPGGAPSRVYEMVSPVDKGGSQVDVVQGFQATPDGDGLSYHAKTPLGGDVLTLASPLFPSYFGRRGASGWDTAALDPPQLNVLDGESALAETLGVSEDGTKAVVISLKKLADGATEGASNTYLRDVATGAYTTMATTPGTGSYRNERSQWTDEFVAGTPDFGHVLLFGLNQISGGYWPPFLPGAPDNALYEFTGGKLRLASVAPDGTPLGNIIQFGIVSKHDPNEVSEDGSRIFFQKLAGPVFVRLNGTTTQLVSASHRTSDAGAERAGIFVGASRDGRLAFIVARDLTDDSDPGVASLYRYTVDTGELTLLTTVESGSGPLESAFGPLQVSQNGEAVYFVSKLDLAPGGSDGALNMYVWRGGHVTHIATPNMALDQDNDRAIETYRASPNGRYLAFAAFTKMVEYDNTSSACAGEPDINYPAGVCREVYRYDADTDTLTCASCRRDGGRATGNASIGWSRVDYGGHHFPRAIMDDGRVFFDTPDPLAADDTNGLTDVYSFDGDATALISTGRGSTSQLADASADGRDVFFTTQDQLVRQDRDTVTDVYDARVGGGIASQTADPANTACSGEDCRGVAPGPVSSKPAPTQTATGTEGRPARPAKAKLKIVSAAFKGTILRLTVNVSGPGRIRVSGAKLATTTRPTSKAGTYRVQVRLTRRQRALRRAGHRVTAKFTVSSTPVFGARAVATLTRTASR
jgi:sugar lactone lactonase YvrE